MDQGLRGSSLSNLVTGVEPGPSCSNTGSTEDRAEDLFQLTTPSQNTAANIEVVLCCSRSQKS